MLKRLVLNAEFLFRNERVRRFRNFIGIFFLEQGLEPKIPCPKILLRYLMNKENILFCIIGLLFGLIIGFSIANILNRNSAAPSPSTSVETTGDSNLPPNHPPFGQSTGQTQDLPLPQTTEAIAKANANPNDFEAQMTVGDLYYQIRRFEEASKFYEIATTLRPNEIEPIVKLGNAYFDSDKYELAEKWYQAALQKTPNDLNVRTDYGLTFFLRTPADVDRAIKEFQLALAIDPNHELSLQNLAVAYKEKNDSINFNKTMETLKKVNPNNPVAKDAGGFPGTSESK